METLPPTSLSEILTYFNDGSCRLLSSPDKILGERESVLQLRRFYTGFSSFPLREKTLLAYRQSRKLTKYLQGDQDCKDK